MHTGNLQLELSNVGGIESDSIDLTTGITALSGENTTNRTSLMNGLMAALGSNEPPIKTGAEEGDVRFDTGEKVYERTVTSTPSGAQWSGEGVVDDIEPLQLFSFLLRGNPVREAVINNDNLYDVVMQPVDTEEIKQEIEELKERKQAIEQKEQDLAEKRENIERLKDSVEENKSKKSDLEEKIDSLEEQIDAIDVQETHSEQLDKSRELNQRLKELSDEKDSLQTKIETLKSKISNRENELAELQDEDFKSTSDLVSQIEEIETEIADLESQISDLEANKRSLSPVQRFLSQLTDDGNTSSKQIHQLLTRFVSDTPYQTDNEDSDPTAALVDSTETCILCGNEIEEGHYEEILSSVNTATSEINSQNEELQSEMSDLRSQRDSLKDELRDIRQKQDKIDELEDEIESLTEQLEQKENELETVVEEYDDVESELDELEESVVEDSEDKTSEVSSLEKDKTQAEIELKRVQDSIEEDTDTIQQLEEEIEAIESDSEEVKPEIESEIESLKGEVDRIETEIVEQFNERMEEIINRLSYESLERIWIEKKVKEVREGRKKVETTVFDLHIVREVDGKATNDSIDNLSESERVVTALVFAFTGYLVHNVGEQFPMVLIDSVEMIDAQRLESLLNYMAEHVDYLVVTTLPEDTEAMDVGSVITRTNNPTA